MLKSHVATCHPLLKDIKHEANQLVIRGEYSSVFERITAPPPPTPPPHAHCHSPLKKSSMNPSYSHNHGNHKHHSGYQTLPTTPHLRHSCLCLSLKPGMFLQKLTEIAVTIDFSDNICSCIILRGEQQLKSMSSSINTKHKH